MRLRPEEIPCHESVGVRSPIYSSLICWRETFPDQRKNMLEDIGPLTSAKAIGEGLDVQLKNIQIFGQAKKIFIDKNNTWSKLGRGTTNFLFRLESSLATFAPLVAQDDIQLQIVDLKSGQQMVRLRFAACTPPNSSANRCIIHRPTLSNCDHSSRSPTLIMQRVGLGPMIHLRRGVNWNP
jgi:hypothetical protein